MKVGRPLAGKKESFLKEKGLKNQFLSGGFHKKK